MTILDNAALDPHESPFALRRTAAIPHEAARFASPITRMLLRSDGLTTTLLESCTGARAHVHHAEHSRVPASAAPAGAADLLEVPPCGDILLRTSTLATSDGRLLSRNDIAARTDIPGADRCLSDPTAPIGFALHAAGTGFRRTVLEIGLREWPWPPGGPAAFKTYLLWHGDLPAVLISELFNPEVISPAAEAGR